MDTSLHELAGSITALSAFSAISVLKKHLQTIGQNESHAETPRREAGKERIFLNTEDGERAEDSARRNR